MLSLDKYTRFTMPLMENIANFPSPKHEIRKKRKGREEIRIRHNLASDILPFSLHYKMFRRPKNLDLNVG